VDDLVELRAGRGGAQEWRTADPSASLDFLSRVAASVGCVWFSLKRTTSGVADESSAAGNSGFARDDKKERVVVGKGRLLEERAAAPRRGLVLTKAGRRLCQQASPGSFDSAL
jgi:hypothetical protein